MKRMVVSILAAMAIMASGGMASAGSVGMDKGKTSDSGTYQGGTYSGSSSDMYRSQDKGLPADKSMNQSGTHSGSSSDLYRSQDKGLPSDKGMNQSGGTYSGRSSDMYRSQDKGLPADKGMNQSGAYSAQTRMSQGSGFEFSKMLGKEVKGMSGDKFGTIKDFVVDSNGHLFALLSRADMAGNTVAVPFEAFSSTDMTGMKKDHLSLNITRDQLTNAPDFNQSSLADRTWSEGVYRHFGIQPRWSDQGMTGQQGTQGGAFHGGSSLQQPPTSQQPSTGSYDSRDQGFQGSGQGSQSSQPRTY